MQQVSLGAHLLYGDIDNRLEDSLHQRGDKPREINHAEYCRGRACA